VLALHLLIVLPTTALGVALLWWARPHRIAVGPAVA
jgi:hypothetical protein